MPVTINFVVANVHRFYRLTVLCWVCIPCSESCLVGLKDVKAAGVVGIANWAALKSGWETRCSEAYLILIMIRQNEIPITGPAYMNSIATGDERRSEKVSKGELECTISREVNLRLVRARNRMKLITMNVLLGVPRCQRAPLD